MNSGAALKQGFGLMPQARRAVWLLFLANLVVAAVAAWPIYDGIQAFTAHRDAARTLSLGFSADWLTDFAMNQKDVLDRYAGFAEAFGLITIFVNTILAGGVFGSFRPQGFAGFHESFWNNAGHYAWRLVRLMLLGLIGYWIVFRLLNEALGEAVLHWTADWQNEPSVVWMQVGAGILLLIALGLLNLVMDFSRVKLVKEEGSSALEALWGAFGFCFSRLGKALVVYAIPSLGGLALLGVYVLVIRWAHAGHVAGDISGHGRHDPLMILALFLLQQAVILGRYWFRVATWASEWSLYA
ncbi:MAG: hypothetical protein ACRD2O_10650 [Terriglobia bacterium]